MASRPPAFFATDFTLAEIKQLRAIQSRAERPQEFNGQFQIPTLAEVIRLALREGAQRGRPVGIYPETKHPTFHFALGLPLEDKLLALPKRYRLDDEHAPVFIQSFETANLQYLHTKNKNPPRAADRCR
jgi:glycerophosphoryl diester phosphodiesterase